MQGFTDHYVEISTSCARIGCTTFEEHEHNWLAPSCEGVYYLMGGAGGTTVLLPLTERIEAPGDGGINSHIKQLITKQLAQRVIITRLLQGTRGTEVVTGKKRFCSRGV